MSLTEASRLNDYEVLPSGRSRRIGPIVQEPEELSIVERFREHHHAIAAMVAAGMTPAKIREQTGVSMRRLTLYLGDPSFNELVAIKAKRRDEIVAKNEDAYLDLGMSNMILAESQIAERLDKAMDPEGEPVSLALLDKISQGRADRFGYSKHSTIRHEHDFSAALEGAIRRSGKGEAMKTIEAKATQVLPQVPPLPEPQEAVPQPHLRHSVERPRSFAGVLSPIKRRRIA